LKEWFTQRRELKDVIVKLHTGQGKTLIGLLILQSKLNQTGEPALYVCPNNNLVQQTPRLSASMHDSISNDNDLGEEKS
jgi:replicative superfamily II helicase